MAKKKIILCDTNILIHQLRGDNEKVLTELNHLGYSSLAISSITAMELFCGMKKAETRITKELVNKYSHFYLDKDVSLKAMELLISYRDKISLGDALIAATAISNSVELYTLNVDDFSFIKGVKLYKPKSNNSLK